MKLYVLSVAFLLVVISAYGQDRLESTGTFGEPIDKKGAVSAKKLAQKMDKAESLDIKVKGTITEVCQAKVCWMTIDLGDDELMRVKFKDYGFFVPKDAAGKTAIIQGVAKNEIIGVDELRHLAKDAGKSEKEIIAIDKPKEELTFVAEGVIIK